MSSSAWTSSRSCTRRAPSVLEPAFEVSCLTADSRTRTTVQPRLFSEAVDLSVPLHIPPNLCDPEVRVAVVLKLLLHSRRIRAHSQPWPCHMSPSTKIASFTAVRTRDPAFPGISGVEPIPPARVGATRDAAAISGTVSRLRTPRHDATGDGANHAPISFFLGALRSPSVVFELLFGIDVIARASFVVGQLVFRDLLPSRSISALKRASSNLRRSDRFARAFFSASRSEARL